MGRDVISLAVEMISVCSAQFCVSTSFGDRANISVIFSGVTGRDVRISEGAAAGAGKHSKYSCVLKRFLRAFNIQGRL